MRSLLFMIRIAVCNQLHEEDVDSSNLNLKYGTDVTTGIDKLERGKREQMTAFFFLFICNPEISVKESMMVRTFMRASALFTQITVSSQYMRGNGVPIEIGCTSECRLTNDPLNDVSTWLPVEVYDLIVLIVDVFSIYLDVKREGNFLPLSQLVFFWIRPKKCVEMISSSRDISGPCLSNLNFCMYFDINDLKAVVSTQSTGGLIVTIDGRSVLVGTFILIGLVRVLVAFFCFSSWRYEGFLEDILQHHLYLDL
eukprot:TRINITY_DN7541_c0_g1_i9.p2 TRINITY_DN7541_c0_g1~~TRINITY_DN7541_c0_g1_i9.p2  ORF type:complete len:254 (-),score=26.70 TRINITY_DN7541_c0_g1_i9:856-1617(-)